jgi:cell division protease FtsH
VGFADISPQTHEEMEAEVDRLIHDAEREASHLLERHRATLDHLAELLMQEETLEGAALVAILDPARVPKSNGSGNGHGPPTVADEFADRGHREP